MQGVGVPAGDSQSYLHGHHSLGSVTEMVAMAASATVSNVVDMIISLRNRSMLNESDDEYPTPSSLTKPEGKSAARGDDVDSERMGSSAPAWGVSRTFLLFVSRSIIPHLF
jgi:hypothetical protein